jgi:hypothetical protein
VLLPDTKLTENRPQNILIHIYLADNGTQVFEGLPDIHGQKVATDVAVHTPFDAFNVFQAIRQCAVVPFVGNDALVAM